ncbi:MAG TPA: 4-alpha-glucanotransferase, partial [Frankiaceae bacterium]|nr:4-alpha-glucanotransferase [Frankiaceae bacterium]
MATSYENWTSRPVPVPAETVRRVLEALGVNAADPAAALEEARERPWRRLLPPTVVVRQAAPAPVVARVPAGGPLLAVVELADGGRVELGAAGPPSERRTVAGAARVAVPLPLPAGLPLGDHRLRVRAGGEEGEALLVVAPDRVPLPSGLHRTWGWMVQLYALRSAGSWGLGDYADLAALLAWSGSPAGGGAGVLLVNPLHAVAPTHPVEPSPYFPTSRRFAAPLYLRPEELPEYAAADRATRARVDALARSAPRDTDLIDRDAAWAAKRVALELLFFEPGPVARPAAEDSPGLADFALWCALAEENGPDWRSWPAELRSRDSPAVAAARRRLAGRVAFHTWLQHCCDEQLARAQRVAREAGMPVGVVHDLAVGVDPGGADAWALQGELASGVTVGAPPDLFNQQGQDWQLPPWRPDRLAETGYAPFRDMVRAVLRRGGGLRVDHVMGLFRLWWVPGGCHASEGTYVRYDHEALVGILALEAQRAGAVVVGEDLGTVEPWVRDYLRERGVFGTSILWFEMDHGGDGGPLPADRWREYCLSSVTTHDLPPSAGYLAGEHVRLRDRLGLLSRSFDEELADDRAEQEAWLAELRRAGLLASDPDVDDTVLALHRYLGRTPSKLLALSLSDAVGDRRTQNQPGTTD